MKTKMRFKISLFVLLISSFVVNSLAQDIPLVYDVENTGASFPLPVLPAFDDLPIVNPLTDPFEWSDGNGRDTTFASWSQRRSEIKAEFERYEIGLKPTRPDTITASYENNLLTVNITENGKTLVLTSAIVLPAGDGPFPAIIGMGGGSGSLPADIFTSRNIAQISFNYSQVMAHTQARGQEPINKLYPDLIYMGAYSAWPWGVSRLIDGLELVQDVLPIDLKHLAVTGCSFAGKMALFAGAFDERIALTLVQESGGGGAAAWRVSQTVGNVENLAATNHAWFIEDMFKFAYNVAKLPHDHHELLAMVAPRALFVIGNPSMEWLAEESGYVSCQAAAKVWESFGISERFGFSFVGDHGHCALPASEVPEVEAFVDKFLLNKTTTNTAITTNSFPDVNYNRWFEWWGNDVSYFPEQFAGETVTIEAECASLGADWYKVADDKASNGAYVVSKEGKQNTKKTTIDEASLLELPFSLDTSGNFTVQVRLNCPTSDNDSFWAKMDDGNFNLKLSLGTDGWEWKKFGSFDLENGEHTLTLAYRENGGQVDKISISSLLYYEPTGMGDDAENLCDPRVGVYIQETQNAYNLGQNYPNPFKEKTLITFEIPTSSYVSLKVYNMLGAEMAELAGKDFSKGKHNIEFSAKNLSKGIYFYTLKADKYTASQKMMIE